MYVTKSSGEGRVAAENIQGITSKLGQGISKVGEKKNRLEKSGERRSFRGIRRKTLKKSAARKGAITGDIREEDLKETQQTHGGET